jgi:hypothetical protein
MGKEKFSVRPDQKEIEEVFVIKTKDINFVGTLFREGRGYAKVYGHVWFRDGTGWGFHRSGNSPADLQTKLRSLSESIAAFYGTDLLRLKLDRAIEYETFARLLGCLKGEMTCA